MTISFGIFKLSMDVSGKAHLNNICTKKPLTILKKLLNKIFYLFSYEYGRDQIEKCLALFSDWYDLENVQKELDRKETYNRFYI